MFALPLRTLALTLALTIFAVPAFACPTDPGTYGTGRCSNHSQHFGPGIVR
jgi:hypothetical protein